jgi:hypothetical protein
MIAPRPPTPALIGGSMPLYNPSIMSSPNSMNKKIIPDINENGNIRFDIIL